MECSRLGWESHLASRGRGDTLRWPDDRKLEKPGSLMSLEPAYIDGLLDLSSKRVREK